MSRGLVSGGKSAVKHKPVPASLRPSGHQDYVNDAELACGEEETTHRLRQAASVKTSSYADLKLNADYNGLGPTYGLDASKVLSDGNAASRGQKVSEIVSAWSSSFEGLGATKQQVMKKLPVVPPEKKVKQKSFSSMAITSQVTKRKEKLERRNIVDPRDSELKDKIPNFPASSLQQTKASSHQPICSSASTPSMGDSLPAQLSPPKTNYCKRSRSFRCREEWVLPDKPPKPVSVRNTQISPLSVEKVTPLPQLVANHWNQFPVSVRVVSGLLEEQLLSRSILDIHFLKKTKVIDISDAVNQHYLIPHNSPIRFGVIYCPGVKSENYYFERVSDIIEAVDLPKVVTCTRKVESREEPSLSSSEVLIVIEIIRGLHSYSKQSRKPKLKVFSFTDRKEKILNGDMVGNFTTDPQLAQFYIPEIIDYIPNLFPLSAHLYMDAGSGNTLPDILVKRPVTIMNCTVKESVIAILRAESMDPNARLDDYKKNVIELPIVSDIMVSVIPDDQIQLNSIENLHTDTQILWKEFVTQPNTSTVCAHVAVSGKTPIQHKLLTLTRKGEERKASAIEAPALVRNHLATIPPSLNLNAYQVLIDGEIPSNLYMPLPVYSSSKCSSEKDAPGYSNEAKIQERMYKDSSLGKQDGELFYKKTRKNIPVNQEETQTEFQSSTHQPVKRNVTVEPCMASTIPQNSKHKLARNVEMVSKSCQCKRKITTGERSEMDKLRVDMMTLQTAFKTLEEEVGQMRREFAVVLKANDKRQQFPKPSGEANENISEEANDNISVLKRLDSYQVLRLLDVLQLGQYKEVFREEAITGEILAECSESVLLHDLHIKDSNHISKLMKVIHGKLSVQELLKRYSDALVRTNGTNKHSWVL